jgi:hypothetical protein
MEAKRTEFYRKIVAKFNRNAHPLFHQFCKFDEANAIRPVYGLNACDYVFTCMSAQPEIFEVFTKQLFVGNVYPPTRSIQISHREEWPYHGIRLYDEMLSDPRIDQAINDAVKGLLVSWEFVLERLEQDMAHRNSNNNAHVATETQQMPCEVMWEKIQQRVLANAHKDLFEEIVERVEREAGPQFTMNYAFDRENAIDYYREHRVCNFTFAVKRKVCNVDEDSLEFAFGQMALGQMELGQVLELYQGVLKWSVRDEEYVHNNVNRSKLIETIVSPIVAALRSVFEKMNK